MKSKTSLSQLQDKVKKLITRFGKWIQGDKAVTHLFICAWTCSQSSFSFAQGRADKTHLQLFSTETCCYDKTSPSHSISLCWNYSLVTKPLSTDVFPPGSHSTKSSPTEVSYNPDPASLVQFEQQLGEKEAERKSHTVFAHAMQFLAGGQDYYNLSSQLIRWSHTADAFMYGRGAAEQEPKCVLVAMSHFLQPLALKLHQW